MLQTLKKALRELPDLLKSDREWESLNVSYHLPHVERLWRPYGEGRVMLHCIHPCEREEALYHPHPWPSAVCLIQGYYLMGVSSTFHPEDDGEHEGPAWTSEHAAVLAAPNTCYEMTDRNGWHFVCPVGAPAWSVMVTGPLYEPPVEMPSPPLKPQKPLTAERFNEMFAEWRRLVR